MSVVKIINDLFAKPRDHYNGDPKFRPSCLGSPCLRKVYYGFHRVEPDYQFPLKNKRITKLGDYIHDLINDQLRKTGHLIDYIGKDGKPVESFFEPGKYDYEFPLKDKALNFSAKIDAVMVDDPNNITCLEVGEWKSINEKGFGYLRDAKPDHKEQAASYFFILNQKLKAGDFDHIPRIAALKPEQKIVKKVTILYYCKNNSEMREFTYEERDLVPYFTNVVRKMEEVKRHTNECTLPPKTSDWCQSCSWRDKCLQSFKVKVK